MGENRWRDEREWPLARTRYTPYYFHSGGRANTRERRRHALRPSRPARSRPTTFVYDPDDPVPTRGGNTLILPMGVQDQRPVEARDDVLVYTSEPVLAPPLEVTGPGHGDALRRHHRRRHRLHRQARRRPPRRLRPEPRRRHRARPLPRLARRRPRCSRPGEVTRFTIDLWATSHVFLPGHRLRVEISSSNFPRFDRNLNTGDDQATGTDRQPARQTIFHDSPLPLPHHPARHPALTNAAGGSAPLPMPPPERRSAGQAHARSGTNSAGGSAPLPIPPPERRSAGQARARSGTNSAGASAPSDASPDRRSAGQARARSGTPDGRRRVTFG